MSDLTDLEICNLIAEIEETPHWQHLGKVVLRAPWSWDKEALEAHIYNPLTDDALCFKLMIKYGLEASPMIDGAWSVTQVTEYNIYGEPDYKLCQYGKVNPHLNKAICLVIIEANLCVTT